MARPSMAGAASRVAVLGLALGLLLPGAARAQMDSREGIALQNQILELRRDLDNLQSRGGGPAYAPPPRGRDGGGGPSADIVAQLLDRITSLEDQVRSLRGQLDESTNAQRRLSADLNKKIDDLNFRLQNAGPPSGGGTAPSPGPSSPGPTASTAGPVIAAPANRPADTSAPRRTPEMAMQEGNAALARRDYPTAEAAAREVLAMRGTPRAADAQFLLAQSLSGARDYRAAAVAYGDAYTRNRNTSRAPDALLGLANSLTAINERESACATLGQLRSEYPNRADLRDPINSLAGRNNCR